MATGSVSLSPLTEALRAKQNGPVFVPQPRSTGQPTTAALMAMQPATTRAIPPSDSVQTSIPTFMSPLQQGIKPMPAALTASQRLPPAGPWANAMPLASGQTLPPHATTFIAPSSSTPPTITVPKPAQVLPPAPAEPPRTPVARPPAHGTIKGLGHDTTAAPATDTCHAATTTLYPPPATEQPHTPASPSTAPTAPEAPQATAPPSTAARSCPPMLDTDADLPTLPLPWDPTPAPAPAAHPIPDPFVPYSAEPFSQPPAPQQQREAGPLAHCQASAPVPYQLYQPYQPGQSADQLDLLAAPVVPQAELPPPPVAFSPPEASASAPAPAAAAIGTPQPPHMYAPQALHPPQAQGEQQLLHQYHQQQQQQLLLQGKWQGPMQLQAQGGMLPPQLGGSGDAFASPPAQSAHSWPAACPPGQAYLISSPGGGQNPQAGMYEQQQQQQCYGAPYTAASDPLPYGGYGNAISYSGPLSTGSYNTLPGGGAGQGGKLHKAAGAYGTGDGSKHKHKNKKDSVAAKVIDTVGAVAVGALLCGAKAASAAAQQLDKKIAKMEQKEARDRAEGKKKKKKGVLRKIVRLIICAAVLA